MVLAGCGGEKKQEVADEAAGVAHQEYPADVAPAQVAVEVRFTGAGVRGERIRMNADPRCQAMHQHDIFSYPVRVSADGMLQNAFVYVKVQRASVDEQLYRCTESSVLRRLG